VELAGLEPATPWVRSRRKAGLWADVEVVRLHLKDRPLRPEIHALLDVVAVQRTATYFRWNGFLPTALRPSRVPPGESFAQCVRHAAERLAITFSSLPLLERFLHSLESSTANRTVTPQEWEDLAARHA
jgi:hypothetical protein